MKKYIFSLALVVAAAICFAGPYSETNRCINPTQNYPDATGYCNNVSTIPGVVVFYCESEIGGLGQTKTCIGNLPSIH